MLKKNDDLRDALRRFADLLDRGEFFEAHEVLEEAWHPLRQSDDNRKSLVRGLINGAICFEHIKRARPKMRKQAVVTIGAYERYKHLATHDISDGDLLMLACEKIEELKRKHADLF